MRVDLIATLGLILVNIIVSIWSINKANYNKSVTESRLKWLKDTKKMLVEYSKLISEMQILREDDIQNFIKKRTGLRKAQSKLLMQYKPYSINKIYSGNMNKNDEGVIKSFEELLNYIEHIVGNKKMKKIKADTIEGLLLNTLEFMSDVLENSEDNERVVIPGAEIRYINEVLPLYQSAISKNEWDKISRKKLFYFTKKKSYRYNKITLENIKIITRDFDASGRGSNQETYNINTDDKNLINKYFVKINKQTQTVRDYLSSTLKRLEDGGYKLPNTLKSDRGSTYLSKDSQSSFLRPATYTGMKSDVYFYEINFSKDYSETIAKKIIGETLKINSKKNTTPER